MRRTFAINAHGELEADGTVLGRVVMLVVDVPSGGLGGSVGALNQAGLNDQPGLETSKENKQKKGSAQIALGADPNSTLEDEPAVTNAPRPEVQEVWAHYLAATHSRRQLKAKDVRLIEAALKLRGLTVVKRAISGLAASPFHNGENAQGKKYLAIRYAIGGNAQTGETAEERIDSMAGLSPDAAADSRFRSRIGANEGRFNALKTTVIQAWRPPDRPPATDAAIGARDEAIVELREFGIAVSFREDGWPIFDELTDHEGIA